MNLFKWVYDWSRILAGSISGLSVLALDDPSRRRTLALYLLARVAQVRLLSFISRVIELTFLLVECLFINFISLISVHIIPQSLRTSFTCGVVIGDTEILCSLL